ncbi:MAG: sirohydrochlorin chelatase [Fimbriiglobus sp.]
MSKNALLLIAHGSRRPEANADLDFVAAAMRERGEYAIIQTSFLELAEPSIAAGGELCVQAGAESVTMLPYFLSAGVHVREDMLEALAELSEKFPAVKFKLAPHLGRHPLLLDIVAQRAQEAETA